MPLQQTVVPQEHRVESGHRFGGTPAAERRAVRQNESRPHLITSRVTMGWFEILQVGAVVVVSLGGGGAIVLGLSRFLGDKWLQDWKGDIDARLQRLDAALQHWNFVIGDVGK